ncbi:MAG: dihydroorotase [Luteibaculum sp.]
MEQSKNFVISGGILFNPKHSLHNKPVSIAVKGGKIDSILPFEKSKASKNEIVLESGAHFLPGFVDLLSDFCDPGMEHREDFESGARTALAGGFTHVALNPHTKPVRDSKSEISYVSAANNHSTLNLIALGTLSEGGMNEQIPELFDMFQSGAKGFYSGKKQMNEQLVVNALRYCDGIAATPHVFPVVDRLTQNGQINESVVSSKTGLKPIPAIAEEIALDNLIAILRYTGGKLHISHISTAASVEKIKKAKKEGLNIRCSVAAHQLIHTDDAVLDFDTRYKVNPPFRSKKDRDALRKACKQGVIDAIHTDHSPIDIEHKKIEFDLAEFGIIGLQTAVASVWTAMASSLTIEDLVNLFSYRSSEILGLEINEIAPEKAANFCVFHPQKSWIFNRVGNHSKSENSPYFDEEFKGQISHTVSKGILNSF